MVVLETLAKGPSNLAELQWRGGAPGSTLRARLRDLVDAGAIRAQRGNGNGRGAAQYELTDSGMDLLSVAKVLQRWLGESPNGHGSFDSDRAKAAVRALVDAWSATLLRALAAKPLSIADLDSLIGAFNYPTLERRIAAMRNAGQVEARRAGGRETPYAVTPWLRRGVAPLLAAIRWERLHLAGGSAPVTAMDVEATLLLAMPLVEIEGRVSGGCRLAVELSASERQCLAGVVVNLEGGAVAACTSRLDGSADAWASGPLASWLPALIDQDETSLELGGDGRLARSLIASLHRALFAPAERSDAVAA